MTNLMFLLLLVSLIALCVWAVHQQDIHDNNHWISALGMPLVLPDAPSPDQDRQREAMLRICIACGYATASEFLIGAERAFNRLTHAALKGDLQENAGLASASARDRICARVAIYSGEMARFCEIIDARTIGHRARLSVRFGRAGVPGSVWKEPVDWHEAGQRARIAMQTWTFERDLRSPDPNWFLIEVVDSIETPKR